MTNQNKIYSGEISNSEFGSIPDKDEIRAKWSVMYAEFLQLLADIPRDAWRRKSIGTRWNIAELCAHIAHDVEGVPMFVDHARRGKDLFNLPLSISNPVNGLVTKFIGRKASSDSLAKKFKVDYKKALAVLDTVQDDEWQQGAHFFGEGFWTVAFIFHQSPDHFAEHAAQIRESL